MIDLEEKRMAEVVRTKPRFGSKTLFAAPRETRTLDDMVTGVRNELVANHLVRCLSCGGVMRPVHGRDQGTVTGGRCRNCGATIS
jgi:hypothetical protein